MKIKRNRSDVIDGGKVIDQMRIACRYLLETAEKNSSSDHERISNQEVVDVLLGEILTGIPKMTRLRGKQAIPY